MHVQTVGPRGGLDCSYYTFRAWGKQVLLNIFLHNYVLYSRSKLFFFFTDGLFPEKIDLHTNNWQLPSLISMQPVPCCKATKHLADSEIGVPNVDIGWHLTGSIQIACRNLNLYTLSVKFLCRLHRLQQARCCYKWSKVDPKLLHTDTWHEIKIKTPFHLPFLMSTIRLYLILTAFCWFLWNWVSFLSKAGKQPWSEPQQDPAGKSSWVNGLWNTSRWLICLKNVGLLQENSFFIAILSHH